MPFLALLRRLRGSFRTTAFEDTMDAELRHHLELETEALIARGAGPAEARELARRRFGSLALVKDDCRDSWGVRAVDTLAQDLRDALRGLRASRGNAALVLLSLAIGIGANTAIFAVVHAVLMRPLPYTHGRRLVEVRQDAPALGVPDAGVSVRELADYRARVGSLDAAVEYHQMWFNLIGQGDVSRVQTGVVSADFFDVLGVAPLLGRTFRAEDDRPDAPAVLVLSHAYWQRALGGDPAIVGRAFEMNDRTHTVVGVLPPGPQFPGDNDVYMPPSACPFRSNPKSIENRNARMLNVIGRLRPEATLESLQRDLDDAVASWRREYPAAYDASRTGFGATALSVQSELTRLARPTLLALLATTTFVLLLVAANVANLTLARVLGRERELAVRMALGAGRARVARQLLTESSLLAVAGGALGLLVGWLVRDLLVAFTLRFTPRAEEIAIDGTVLAFTFGVSIVTGLLSGMLPALTTRPSAVGLSRAGRLSAGRSRFGARQALIATQVAIAFVLLVGAGLLARSVVKLEHVDPGFRADRVLTMRIDLDFVKYDDVPSRRAFFRSVLEKVAAEPGLQTAALSFTVPLDDTQPMRTPLIVEGGGHGAAAGAIAQQPQADLKFASPAYFETIGMTRLSGRLLTDDDVAEAAPVAVVNLSMARHYFPGLDPVGRRVSLNGGTTWVTVVGVVNDVRQYGLATTAADELYQPFARTGTLSATLLVRTAGDPNAYAQRIPAIVREIDPRQPVSRVQTLEAIRSRSLAPPRLTALLVALFALVALVVTAAGIAGVASFSVNQRRAEIGIRMALGAPRQRVTGMIVRQGMMPVMAGVSLGLVSALLLTRVAAQLLFAVEPSDPLTYSAVAALLAMVASLACLAPARRAAAIDPMRTLRAD